jgi:drug/metabolite transporter (DMT)-like permease
MVHVAETRIDSSVAAMIAGSVPLQVVLMRLAVHEPVARTTKLFAAIGLGGLALVILPGSTTGSSTALGLLIMVGASIAWATGSFVSRSLPLPRDAFVATVYEMIGGGLALLLLSLVFGEWATLDADSFALGPVLAWVYLAIAGSVIGFTAYAWLLRRAPISQVVTHQYVNPIVAIALGSLILDETLAVTAAIGATVVLVAVFFTVRTESRGAAEPSTRPATVDSPA